VPTAGDGNRLRMANAIQRSVSGSENGAERAVKLGEWDRCASGGHRNDGE